MSQNASQSERRRAERRVGPPVRIAWEGVDFECTHSGWINDESAVGVAFVTSTRTEPAPGDEIELTYGAGTRSPRYRTARVVRTAPYDRYFSVVGCQLPQ
ncbi:MAG: PilZ domain-containing protein [Phycisphaerae bacterium]|nr:PilZ domain-containing protein [Phycisphaerae bacterium]